MKKILSLILAAVFVMAFGASVLAVHNTKTVTLLPSAARSKAAAAVTTGSAVSTLLRANTVTGGSEGFTRHMSVFLDVTGATTATEDLTIEGRFTPSGNWVALAASSAWTQVTATGEQVRRYEGPIPNEIRAVLTTGSGTGTSASTISVTAVLGG